MTCIIAIKAENSVMMAADSALTIGSIVEVCSNKLIKTDHLLIGFAGDKLVQNEMVQISGLFDEELTAERVSLIWGNLKYICDTRKVNGELLVCDKKSIYYFGNFVGFRLVEKEFCCIGNVRDIAYGSMLALKDLITDPKERMKYVLELLAKNCSGVREPFHFEKVGV